MTLQDIAFQNLLRRKRKTVFMLIGLIIGVATVVSMMTLIDGMTGDINYKLNKYGANILIVPKTENLTLSYGGLTLGGVSFEMQEIQEKSLERIQTIEYADEVAAIGPMVLGVVTAATHRVLLAGIDLEAVHILKPWWSIEGAWPNPDELLLGSEAARVLQVKTGDTLAINDRPLLISGVLQLTSSQDDHLIFARLATVQDILRKPGQVSMAEVAALCIGCPIEEMVREIAEVLPDTNVTAVQQVAKSRVGALAQLRVFSFAVTGVVILIGALVVLVTMMGSVKERTEEIGILRALGFGRWHIMQIILLEAAIISSIAGLFGYLIGFCVTELSLGFFVATEFAIAPVRLLLALEVILLTVGIGSLASLYPALLAAKLDPYEALRAL